MSGGEMEIKQEVPVYGGLLDSRRFTDLEAKVALLMRERCGCHYCASGDGLNCTYRRGR